jgi:hypothetical protein
MQKPDLDLMTAYKGVEHANNSALGQCYPTSRVVQHYFPETQIIKGIVWTGASEEVHFWNGLRVGQDWHHIDLTWQQFPAGSIVRELVVLGPLDLTDGPVTTKRCAILLKRVEDYLLKLSWQFPSRGTDS